MVHLMITISSVWIILPDGFFIFGPQFLIAMVMAENLHKHAQVLLSVSLVSSPILVRYSGAPLCGLSNLSTGMDSCSLFIVSLACIITRFRVLAQRKKIN